MLLAAIATALPMSVAQCWLLSQSLPPHGSCSLALSWPCLPYLWTKPQVLLSQYIPQNRFVFWGAEDGTQGLPHTRQALYH